MLGSQVRASCYNTTANHDSILLCAEFGAILASELTDEKDRAKMTGSLIFCEAESIEDVCKIVESAIYYANGVVRLNFPRSTIQSISFVDFV